MSFKDGNLVYVDNNREKIYEITAVLWEQNHEGNRLWFVWNYSGFAYVPENRLTHIEKGSKIALKTGII